jgi:hypothetical protein
MDLRNSMTDSAYGATLPITADNTPVASVQGKNGVLQKLELWLERKVGKCPEAKNLEYSWWATAPPRPTSISTSS